MIEYDLFFDESGLFNEQPLINRDQSDLYFRLQGPSQLAGLLVKRGTLNRNSAKDILEKIFATIERQIPHEVHGTELRSDDSYHRLIQSLLKYCSNKNWQPVILVNKEQIGFGNKVSTYTHMVAEFVLDVFSKLYLLHERKPISLKVTGAIVIMAEGQSGTQISISALDYEKKINEYLSFAAVRRGLAQVVSMCKFEGIQLISARQNRELQICDLLSNASFNNFRRCSDENKANYLTLLNEYYFSFFQSDLLFAMENYIQNGSFASAIQLIVEETAVNHSDPEIMEKINNGLQKAISHLLIISPSARNAQLSQLEYWAIHLLELRRELKKSFRLIKWIETNVADQLIFRSENPENKDLIWFSYSLKVKALSVLNHTGRLEEARQYFNAISRLTPDLAGQWEHAPLLIDALINQAVHLTDCLDYEKASRSMQAVAEYYSSLSDLMDSALPGIFPDRVRSTNRGRALGTWLQSEMLAGLGDSTRLVKARQLNELALEEFTTNSDKMWQYQYRCQIETMVGQLNTAKQYLGDSIAAAGSTHNNIARAINLIDESGQGFPLLHWTRIAAEACRREQTEEVESFYRSFVSEKLKKSKWMIGKYINYPTHGILRNIALVYAFLGLKDDALSYLTNLRKLDESANDSIVIEFIKIASAIEIAAILSNKYINQSKRLLFDGSQNVSENLRKLKNRVAIFPGWEDILFNMEKLIREFQDSEYLNAKEFIQIARLVGY